MNNQCSVCRKPLLGSDTRKQYCSNACKQEAHRQRHGLTKPSFLTSTPNKPAKAPKPVVVAPVKEPPLLDRVEADKRFLAVSQAIVELNSKVYRLQLQKDSLLSKIAPLEARRSPIGDVATGLERGADLGKQWGEAFGSTTAAKIGVALGLISGFQRMHYDDHEEINRKNRTKTRVLRAELSEVDGQINDLTAKRIYLENGLNQLKRDIKTDLLALAPQSGHSTLPGIPQGTPLATVQVRSEGARVISLSELKAQEFDVYNFSNGFEEIIGNPSKNFSMVVYGESGQGKSTWVIDFANYLAEQHGRVLYNSSEEKISASLKRKLLKYDSDNFAISECQTYKALKQAIRGNSFKFVVIDSINDMDIKPNQLTELRELNADKAFIYIMQATKQGNYKGSTQFVHDVDILIKLDNYQPIVEKTRYR